MSNKIALDFNHPDKSRVEYFLNSIDDTLESVPYDWHTLKESQNILHACQFRNIEQSLTVTVFFATSYERANRIAEANSFRGLSRRQWSVNGSLSCLVESKHEDKISDILSLFAGKE